MPSPHLSPHLPRRTPSGRGWLRKQAGRTLWCWLVSAALFAIVAVAGLRGVPVLMEYQSVAKAARQAARAETPADARAAFDRIAQVEGIRSVKGADLRIEDPATGSLRVSFAYQRELPLAGPVFLTFKLAGSAP